MDALAGADPIVLTRGTAVRPLPPLDVDAAALGRVFVGGVGAGGTGEGRGTIVDVLRRHGTLGLVVLHRGRLAYEWYPPGGDRGARHPCYSVTKSFTGTLAALAVHDGVLDRAARVGDLVRALARSGFGDATVGQVADMTVSLAYDEDYADAAAGESAGDRFGFGDYVAAIVPRGAGPAGGLRGLLARIGRGQRPHGEAFAYATPATDVLGWLLEEARGRSYADLLLDGIWRHVGAQHDAAVGRAADGTPLVGAGLATTTRDLARAGALVAERRHVPAAIVESIRARGDPGAFRRGGRYAYLAGYAYRDQWWLAGGAHRPLTAWGIHGQLLWIDPDAELVVACHSAGHEPSDRRRDLDHDALCRALTAQASAWATP